MVTFLLISFILAYVAVQLVQGFLSWRKLPPGPYGLPLVGYLPFITKKPHEKLFALKKQYGAMYSLRMGLSNAIVLNDWETVKDAFSNPAILGRPAGLFGGITKTENIGSASGDLWKVQRRFAHRVFHELGFGKQTMENNIKDELKYLVDEIDANLDKPYDVNEILAASVSNNICYALFGRRYHYDDPTRIRLNQIYGRGPKVLSTVSGINFFNFLVKIFLYFDLFGMKKTMDGIDFVKRLVNEQVQRHEETLSEDSLRDYIDGYLLERKRRVAENDVDNFSVEVMKENARIFFAAGSETVKTTLSWLLLLTATRPIMQKRVQKEIDEVIGNRPPSWADRAFLPVTQAVINETQRWASPVPLNMPRRAMENTTIQGQFIPKDTTIIANLWAVNMDEDVWEDPESFDPDRFLSENGQELLKAEALIPYSYGKRACVGETLARFELFLYYTLLLQRYNVSLPDGTEVTFEASPGLTLSPKQPPVYIFSKRQKGP